MPAESLNWLAIVSGTIAGFLFGWLVYAPGMLGRRWAAGSGVAVGAASSLPVFAMLSQIAALFVLALVIGVTATTSALGTAVLAIVAAALFSVSNGAFLKKSGEAMAIDGGYIVGAGVLMILAQAIF